MSQVATAVVFESPGTLSLREVGLPDCDPSDCLVEVDYSGISTGTERLLWDGRMPPFPGLNYPLVPGYESVGRVITAGPEATVSPGSVVFIPGSRGFQDVAGLFGGAARQLVVNSSRLVPLQPSTGAEGVLLALIATAVHAIKRFDHDQLPELVVGHGVLGRLVARICVALGPSRSPSGSRTQPARTATATIAWSHPRKIRTAAMSASAMSLATAEFSIRYYLHWPKTAALCWPASITGPCNSSFPGHSWLKPTSGSPPSGSPQTWNSPEPCSRTGASPSMTSLPTNTPPGKLPPPTTRHFPTHTA